MPSDPGTTSTINMRRVYNAAHDLLQPNLDAGRGEKTAFIDDRGATSYRELDERSSSFAHALGDMGISMEQRILLCLHDSADFPIVFLGAIKAGVVPVAVNTLLSAGDYEYMLDDSRARIAIVSAPLLPLFAPLLGKLPCLQRILVSGAADAANTCAGVETLAPHFSSSARSFPVAPTRADDICFWLYSSGSTGLPKATVHAHGSLMQTAQLYALPLLGLTESDVVFSAAKLFFAYGLGNGLSFPLAAGATTVLMAERPTPAAVFKRLRDHRPTVFYGVPTLYAALLASADLPPAAALALRRCTSAGEALPANIAQRWLQHFGVDILDGIGSTEMLHIFLSNRPDDVRYGTTGKAVAGYRLRIVDDDGRQVDDGQSGELQIAGPTAAIMYWSDRDRSRRTFVGEWTRSGDKYHVDPDGYYIYEGRTDDMLKVGGIYVSPAEVEASLITHPAVLEAAVVGKEDENKLVKPIAFVVLRTGQRASVALAEELRHHVKTALAPFKYPRWIEFVDELPKTATGKIQRFKLRALTAAAGNADIR